jgi:hypothetical protein
MRAVALRSVATNGLNRRGDREYKRDDGGRERNGGRRTLTKELVKPRGFPSFMSAVPPGFVFGDPGIG